MSSNPESTPSEPNASLVGRMIHKYEIVRMIGRGGMGTVYEALNTAISKRVAIKFIDAEMTSNKDAVARFQREAQAASAVESAHIVEIFDSGITDDGLPFIVMELLRGEDLGHRIKRCGRLELAESLHVITQILRGLHRAHEAGIVHRDLKPDNVFLVDRDDDPNFAKIVDFGISKVQRRGDVPAHTLTRQGTVLGTPFYMSPEQAQALGDIDGRTDLWSVGAILFECLTGRAPHSGSTYEQVIINICMKDVDDVRTHNPAVPEGIARVIARAMTREREDRFGSAREFLDALVSSAGGMISSRSGRTSGEDVARISNPVGGKNSSTPSAAQFAPTLAVQSGSHSKVGWSTSSGLTGRRDRTLYVVVSSAALLLAGVGVFMYSRLGSSAGEVATADAEITLASNVEGARFLVDGALLPGGVLKGTKGARRMVRAEAEGHQPVDAEITIDPSVNPVRISFAAPSAGPMIDPGPPIPEPTATAATVVSAAVSTVPNGGKPPSGKGRLLPPPTKATGAPVITPPPKATGVAGGWKIKED